MGAADVTGTVDAMGAADAAGTADVTGTADAEDTVEAADTTGAAGTAGAGALTGPDKIDQETGDTEGITPGLESGAAPDSQPSGISDVFSDAAAAFNQSAVAQQPASPHSGGLTAESVQGVLRVVSELSGATDGTGMASQADPGAVAPIGSETGGAPDLPAGNPVFYVDENPFPLEVLSFKTIDDALISGTLELTNNSTFEIINAYFELTLDYNISGVAVQKKQFAYVKNLDLKPGGNMTVSYATVPPVNGVSGYTLAAAVLRVIDTNIDGEACKVYNDTELLLLEVLTVASY
jgi:hypothetical protein